MPLQDKKEKHHHHHHHHRRHKKSTSEDLLVPTGSTESPNVEQYSMLLQTSASASDISSAANGPATAVNRTFYMSVILQLLVGHTHTCTHAQTHTHNLFTALWTLSGTTRMSRYQQKHSPTYTYCGHHTSLIYFLHLLQSMASSLFNLHALQSFSTISLQVLFGLPLGLAPSASYSIHFFTQSFSSFRSTCPYHCNLFCCTHTHNRFTAVLEYVRDHLGEQVPER